MAVGRTTTKARVRSIGLAVYGVLALGIFSLASCGGRAGKDEVPGAVGGSDAGVSICPGDGETPPAICVTGPLNLPFVQGTSERSPEGIVVEALQIPEFTEANRGHVITPEVPPEAWDRSELPSGACVFRLHGFHASCYARGVYGDLFVGSCPDASDIKLSPGSFWNLQGGCQPGPAPGCPASNWGSIHGYWWYLNTREDATDLVICAPECKGSFIPNGACLNLVPRP